MSDRTTGTEFTSETTNQGVKSEPADLTMMSPAGKKLASKTAPASAFEVPQYGRKP
jgi:hypothetical protein